ncbi:MAG: DUF5330 domain-containing protein [Methyloligellaceae bacterium]
MGLLRTAFWVVVIILLLPTNHDDQKKAYSLAKATVGDISSFCDRNPGTCHQGQEAFVVFKEKAAFAARMVMDLVRSRTGNMPPEPAGYRPNLREPNPTLDQPLNRPLGQPANYRRTSPGNTLSRDDLKPGWSGPSLDPEA